MTLRPGPQRALGSRGQTINSDAWPYFDAFLLTVSAITGVPYDDLVLEGTRTAERQDYLYRNRNRPGFNPAWPSTSDNAFHMKGDALDVGAGAGRRGSLVQLTCHSLGPQFGIFFELDYELWHARFIKSRAPKTLPTQNGNNMPTMGEFLNFPAWDDGPTISEFFLRIDRRVTALEEGRAPLVTRDGQLTTANQDQADTNTMVRQLVDGKMPLVVRDADKPTTKTQDDADTGTLVRELHDRLDAIVPRPKPKPPTGK